MTDVNQIITWLRDQAIRAPEDVLKRGMNQAADAIAWLTKEVLLECGKKNQYREELAKLKEQHRWIPVTERLPQEDLPVGAVCEVVQVLLNKGTVTVGFCNRKLKCWFYLPVDKTKFVGHGYDLTPVVAWKPLSDPPKEGV